MEPKPGVSSELKLPISLRKSLESIRGFVNAPKFIYFKEKKRKKPIIPEICSNDHK
jgi:hypothetical protein